MNRGQPTGTSKRSATRLENEFFFCHHSSPMSAVMRFQSALYAKKEIWKFTLGKCLLYTMDFAPFFIALKYTLPLPRKIEIYSTSKEVHTISILWT